MNDELTDYYFAHDEMFVVPIEHLGPDGMSEWFRDRLAERGVAGPAWADLFDDAFRLYWTRAARLTRDAPAHFVPPRVQHVCIATEPHAVRPYFQPFHQSSWLLYASDFEPATSTVEFAAYQFLHAERMGLLKQVVPSLFANLGYFLVLEDDEAGSLRDGCFRTTRPDAAGFRALGNALAWIRTLHHVPLKPPLVEIPGVTPVPSLGLLVPPGLDRDFADLEQGLSAAAADVMEKHRAAHAEPSPRSGATICDWLMENGPRLLVTADEGRIVWDPDAPAEVGALRDALAGVTASAEESIRADLEVVAFHNARFLDAMREPDGLVDPAPHITEEGLSYVHKERKLVAYSLGHGGNEGRLWQRTPPYERYMLGARTVHEWGHLAAESGWVGVPEEKAPERGALLDDLVVLFEEIHETAPEAVRAGLAAEAQHHAGRSGSLGQALRKGLMIRIEDYQANLLASRFLRPEEMDTYVRNNVSCHWDSLTSGGLYYQMARQAYEFQYLGLSRIEDREDWFLKSTWFREFFLQNGILTEEQFRRLTGLLGRICACYEIDETKLDLAGL